MLTPQQGEVIAQRYRLERELARGGMGSVWSGQDNKLRRKVAVKLVAPDWDPDGENDARERFEREAMAVAQLQSPHVVQVYDFGVERGFPFIVMELLEGEDLRTRLHTLKRVSLETAGQILVQTAKALSVAHAAGVVHRDLKPGNIFLVRSGEEEIVKILDFGVAKSQLADLLDGPMDEGVMGTPQFMAPEQARGIEVDHRADLWSLGVIIYKALSGRLPFSGRTPTSVIVKVCTCDPQPISQLAPDLPRELDAFFRRALAREPEQRFASARELALAFSRITPITFTTLSMPDPKEIEAAIASARAAAAAADDDNLETLAVDAASFEALQRLQDPPADDLKTSLHIPASLGLPLGLGTPPKSTLPEPKLPKKRRATDGPPSSAAADRAPSSAAGPPPPPSRPMRLPPPLSGRGAPRPPDSQDELPTTASMPFLEASPESATSAPMLLSRAGALAAGDLFGPEPISEPSVSAPLRPSTPTLRGIGEHDSTPPPARHTRPTLLMAAAAVLVGVLVAVIGSAVKSESEPVAGEQVRASHGPPQANGSADVAARGDGAVNEHAAESSAADADDAQSAAAEPSAAESDAAESNAADSDAATVAKSDAPHSAKPPGANGKAPPSTASKTAAAKSEPPKSEPPKSEPAKSDPPKSESNPDKAPPKAKADPFAERL